MQAINPAAFIPYWRWSVNRSIPAWIKNVLPTVAVPAAGGLPAGTIQVTRAPHNPSGLPTRTQIASLDANTGMSYTQFTTMLEGYHNVVHGWVGGTMNDITVSPADPIFWMHHAEIDRIWSAWQASPANAGKTPMLAGSDALMDPWQEQAPQLQSIGALGYSYA